MIKKKQSDYRTHLLPAQPHLLLTLLKYIIFLAKAPQYHNHHNQDTTIKKHSFHTTLNIAKLNYNNTHKKSDRLTYSLDTLNTTSIAKS